MKSFNHRFELAVAMNIRGRLAATRLHAGMCLRGAGFPSGGSHKIFGFRRMVMSSQ